LPSIAIWIIFSIGLVEKVNNNQTRILVSGWHESLMNFIATDVTLID
jgi:hypothetical protein